ncbi:hypothetical protein FB45DRAFT_1096885, partial [Roridomyces roridus]
PHLKHELADSLCLFSPISEYVAHLALRHPYLASLLILVLVLVGGLCRAIVWMKQMKNEIRALFGELSAPAPTMTVTLRETTTMTQLSVSTFTATVTATPATITSTYSPEISPSSAPSATPSPPTEASSFFHSPWLFALPIMRDPAPPVAVEAQQEPPALAIPQPAPRAVVAPPEAPPPCPAGPFAFVDLDRLPGPPSPSYSIATFVAELEDPPASPPWLAGYPHLPQQVLSPLLPGSPSSESQAQLLMMMLVHPTPNRTRCSLAFHGKGKRRETDVEVVYSDAEEPDSSGMSSPALPATLSFTSLGELGSFLMHERIEDLEAFASFSAEWSAGQGTDLHQPSSTSSLALYEISSTSSPPPASSPMRPSQPAPSTPSSHGEAHEESDSLAHLAALLAGRVSGWETLSNEHRARIVQELSVARSMTFSDDELETVVKFVKVITARRTIPPDTSFGNLHGLAAAREAVASDAAEAEKENIAPSNALPGGSHDGWPFGPKDPSPAQLAMKRSRRPAFYSLS